MRIALWGNAGRKKKSLFENLQRLQKLQEFETP